MPRKIIHVDMDAFFASVEQRENPELKGKPVAVGGKPEQRAVVAAASYEAREFGIHSAMSMARALKLCPSLIIVNPTFELYKEASEQIMKIFAEYTDKLQPLSLDECYLDVSEDKKGIGSAVLIAKEIRKRIKEELRLTASAGAAENKLLAKIASDINKPDGLCVIHPKKSADFIKKLDVGKLWGVGSATKNKLYSYGIKTCAELQEYTMEELVRRFGKYGRALYSFCRGIDDREVEMRGERKSVGAERTFSKDVSDPAEIRARLKDVVKKSFERLERRKLCSKTISLKLRYFDFTTITRCASFANPLKNEDEAFEAASLLLKKTKAGVRPVRLLGVSFSSICEKEERELQPLLPFGE